ncbi:response regulator [Candidatus Woesearchaeota archaeon]|nr:response regulator [Candidatus Woesearchaeota archaeon]
MATALYIDDMLQMPFVKRNYEGKLHGHKLLLASSGKEGLELLASQQVDWLFLDWKMPGMNGGDVLREMARQGLEVPVVVCSSEGRDEITKGVAGTGYKHVKEVKDKLSTRDMEFYLAQL